jgi:hypothetical protein
VRGVARNGPGQATAHGEHAGDDPTTPPMEEVPAKDRKALRGLIGHGMERSDGGE